MDEDAESTDGRRPPSVITRCRVIKARAIVKHHTISTDGTRKYYVGTGQVLCNLSNVQIWSVSRTAAVNNKIRKSRNYVIISLMTAYARGS